MQITYAAQKEDFVTFQLYSANHSPLIIKRRKKSRIIVPILYIFLGASAYALHMTNASIVLLIVAVLWYLLYPVWEKGYYRRYFMKHTEEHYKNQFDKPVTTSIEFDVILSQEGENQSKISTKEIESISEIEYLFLIKLLGGVHIIIPKRNIKNEEQLRKHLNDIAQHLSIPYVNALSWTWK